MTRKEEIVNYANSFKGKGMENEELKAIIRLAIIDGALWADKTMIDKVCDLIVSGKVYWILKGDKEALAELIRNEFKK